MAIAALILAAGAGSRLGRPKANVVLGDRTLLARVSDLAVEVGLDPVVAVVPPGTLPPAGTLIVINDRPEAGVSHSLRLGLAAVPPAIPAAVVLLVDQPTMPLATVRSLLDAPGDRPLRAVRADGHLGPPVLISRAAFPLATALVGDVGLREVLQAHPEFVDEVVVDDHPPDVDTPADLEALTRRLESAP